MPGCEVRSENTQTFIDPPGRHADVLIVAPGRSPVVVEAGSARHRRMNVGVEVLPYRTLCEGPSAKDPLRRTLCEGPAAGLGLEFRLAGANGERGIHRDDEDLTVAGVPGEGGFLDDLDR